MKKPTSSIFILFFLCWYTFQAQEASNKSSWISKHPIGISIGTHAIGLPFNQFLSDPFYPELNIDVQSTLMDKTKINLNMTNGVGFASHPFNGNRYFINTYFNFKYKFPYNIYGQTGLGIAFNLLTPPNESYELDNNGVYEEKNSLKTELYGGFNIEIGYHIAAVKNIELDIFSKYNAGINLFHHPEIPLFPYNSTQVGVRFYFKK